MRTVRNNNVLDWQCAQYHCRCSKMSWFSEFSGRNHTSKDKVQGINIKAVSEIISYGTPKNSAMFKVKHNLEQWCVQLKHVVCHVLDIPDFQDYSRNSDSPKMPIIKYRTFEHFLKFLPDAEFNPKFQKCAVFSGRYGNPTTIYQKVST